MDLLRHWAFAVLAAGLVLVAFLVNRFAPMRRRRLRHTLLLYFVFCVATGASRFLAHFASASTFSWVDHVQLLANIFGAFTVVNLLALVVFDVALPALGLAVVGITGDIVVGSAYVFAAFGVLRSSGVAPSSVITTSAVVSGVIALSMQATLGNVVGGFALQLDGSIRVGDWIQLPDGQQGRVMAIRWRHTVIETRNWDTVVVPNASLLSENIVILGKRAGQPVQRRVWVYFNVDFRYAPAQVVDVVSESLGNAPIEGVAEDPRPNVVCCDFAKEGRDSFACYAVRYWLNDLANDDVTSSRIRSRIYAALKRAGVPLARPAQTLFIAQEENDVARAARQSSDRMVAIERVDLFHGLTRPERDFVAAHLKYAPFAAGETVTRQGAVAHWLYVLCSGKVEIRRRAEGGSLAKAVATIEAPNFFGEMGLMTGERRTADVVALTDVECYRLDKEGLQRILEERPEAAENFSKTLARRRVELAEALEGLDAEAKKARMNTEQTRILDKIQQFFGLARTSRLIS
ncbi:MAG: mechanosensitive ion channel family protein [Myxococcota bacterium]|nr:mechanosensitive ion channel family protein [Myxococcota bacterium]